MTPAERALLLAVGNSVEHLVYQIDGTLPRRLAEEMRTAITAVKAEPVPKTELSDPCRSCTGYIRENNAARCALCDLRNSYERRQDAARAKPSAASDCPTCKGRKSVVEWVGDRPYGAPCPTCKGRGELPGGPLQAYECRKENRND